MITGMIFSIPTNATSTLSAATFIKCIKHVKEVALQAMCLTRSLCRQPCSSKGVVSSCNDFKVNWVDTCRGATQMVDIKAVRYWFYYYFVSYAMAKEESALDSNATIAKPITSSYPKPTWNSIEEGAILVNLGPETLEGDIIKEHRKHTPFGVMRQGVYAPLSPLILSQAV